MECRSIYPENSISRIPHSSIAQFCKPYFKRLKISYFHYFRYYNDGSAFQLHHNLKFHYHFWEHSSAIIVPPSLVTKQPKNNEFSSFKNFVGNTYIENLKKETGIADPIILHFTHNDHTDFFCFASPNNQADHFLNYLNASTELTAMALEFTDQFKPMLQKAHKERVFPKKIVAENPFEMNLLELSIHVETPSGINKVLMHPRELTVLQHMVKGLSASKIAELMHKSPRTVEKYIDEMRYKLQCSNKSELIQIGLRQFYDQK